MDRGAGIDRPATNSSPVTLVAKGGTPLDPNLKDRMVAALKASRADFTDIRLEFIDTTAFVYQGGKLQESVTGHDVGGIVRALVRGSWGLSSFNRLDDLPARVAEAYDCAIAAPPGAVRLAAVDPVVAEIRAPIVRDFRQVALAQKQALAKGYSDLILSRPAIRDARVTLGDRYSDVYYASSEGAFVFQERPYAALMMSATACDPNDANNVQTASDSLACGLDYGLAEGRDDIALEVSSRAKALLAAETIRGGLYTVVLSPRMAGLFVHEAFGHLSESDFLADNPKAQEMMTLGRRFGGEFLNISDGGRSASGLRGSLLYDDEGTPTGETDLVREGVLVGRLHSRETAGKMGEKPTGNARATFYRYPPIVRMTNTRIKPGPHKLDDLIKDIKLGIYAKFGGGGQTFLENFSFASGGSYMIRDGQVAELVKDVNFGGNLFKTMANIDGIADDFTWLPGSSSCGKGQEMFIPVGMGAPHVRVREVLIGGR